MRTGLPQLERQLDDVRELPVALVLEADVAGIDAVLVERFGAGRVLGQQLVADVVEVADERHAAAALHEPIADVRHGLGGFVAVDGDAHQLASRRAPAPPPAPTVPSMSAVSVLVIDCTTTGCLPPTTTPATSTATEWRRGEMIDCAAVVMGEARNGTAPLLVNPACTARARGQPRWRTAGIGQRQARLGSAMTSTIAGPPGASTLTDRPRPDDHAGHGDKAGKDSHALGRRREWARGDRRHDQKRDDEQHADDLDGDGDRHREQRG